MNLGRKGFCVYAALVGAAALVVVNPIVVGFFLPVSDMVITAYLVAIDLALLTIIGLSLIHFGTGGRCIFICPLPASSVCRSRWLLPNWP